MHLKKDLIGLNLDYNEIYLKLFGTDLWKSITTQEAYQEYLDNFTPQFKG